MKTVSHLRWLVFPLAGILWFTLCAAAQLPTPSTPNQFEWRFSLQPNQIVSSNIMAENTCRKRQRFEIALQDLPPFMHLSGESSFNVAPHSQHNFPVRFDSTGLQAGEYEGIVVVRCATCKRESGCAQDREVLHIYMTVAEMKPVTAPDFVPDRILVVIPFDSPAGVRNKAQALATAHKLDMIEIHRLQSLNAALIVYALPPTSDVLAKVAELLPEVLIAQPDYLYQTTSAPLQQDASLGRLQYGPSLIHIERLRGSLSGKRVRIAIIDTGVDTGHPALKGKVVEQSDVTGKGFTPDIHGTLLTGIIAGDLGSSKGISGIAPGSEILAVKACQPLAPQTIRAQCWSLTLAQGMDFAIQKRSQVINLSLGGPGEKLLTQLINQAINRGTVVVAAAGNDGPRGQPSFPAALPNVIAVTAVDANARLYPEATQGDFVDLAAPGVEVVSTSPGGRLSVSSGTSFAAAFVTGTAALILEQQPHLSPQALQSLLERTSQDLGAASKDPQFGSGLVDACQAIAELKHDSKLCH